MNTPEVESRLTLGQCLATDDDTKQKTKPTISKDQNITGKLLVKFKE